ncbi:AAA family ATPase [Aquincola sp. S2]|uniref:AAA family ATPase n=1 Tax=Pseudaquabacterium terrae TaxID=2732868 RepID=A0ABX2EE35_9BURK|nr:adenylate/guanylate cyclase domain-containing protein [Aquabacterium terrae]NRF66882.1 AAA family ATPase [Aquabacterium terrae]
MNDEPPRSVRRWLEDLGLEQYAERFERHAIDFELLPALGEAELDRLGVQVLGHRIKLSRAIAALAAAPPRPGRAFAPAAPAPAGGPERRQLTVMFCDLVGSTALSQTLDPEDLRLLMQRYQQICGAAVERYDGHVGQYLGDGLMVYFGWPRAHEDGAQRALQAALEIVDTVKAIPAAQPLRVRIGIATGAVVVGETVGGDVSLPKTAIGETPNVAARVQALAEPDQIMIAATTRRLVADAFECEDRGEQMLKGIAQPVQVWRVLGEGRADGRFAAAHGARLTPLVNRDQEISLLLDRWSSALAGRGQAVLLVGDAGIGKSRITAELCAQAGDGSVLIRMQCSALHRHSAFYPVIASLQRAAGFERGDTPSTKLDKLEALLQRFGAPRERVAPPLALLLSLPLDRYTASQGSPHKQKRDIIEALVAIVSAASRKTAVLLVFEDLHWVDPTTMEVVDAIVAAIHERPVLLVMTSRNDIADRWEGHPHVARQRLLGLDRGHSLRLAVAVAVKYGLPRSVLDRIVDRTDGVPLFLEEVTRALLDSDTLRLAATQTPADSIEIPATLKDSLTARLDQLGPARRCAQYGAVLGRQFRHDAVLALSGMAEQDFNAQMAQLLGAGLVTRSGEGPGVVYTFHHALIQDAAYETLLKTERRALHARAGEVLSEHFPELADTEPEVLARHYTAGEDYARAVPLWLKAGQRAWLRSAAPEAMAHLSAGIALVARLEDAASRDSLELRLQSALGVVYFAAVSYASPQAHDAISRAAVLCERVPDVTLKVPVLYGVGAFQTMKGDIRAGHEAFERLIAEADASAQPRLRLYAHSVLTWSLHNCGRFADSLPAADETAALYAAGAMAGPRLSAADPKIISECHRASSLWALGHVDQARAASDGVLAHARALGDPYSLAYALNYAALLVPERCGERELVLERSAEGIALARELGYPFLEAFGMLWHAWAQGAGPAPAAAQRAMSEGMQRIQALGVKYHLPQLLARNARLLLRSGQTGAAQLEVAQALAQLESSGEHSVEVDVYLAEGEVLQAAGGEQQALAEAAYRLALDVAREQGARSWELRAAMALARLWADAGNRQEARALLAPTLGSFTEGHTTADLRQAAALLASLN